MSTNGVKPITTPAHNFGSSDFSDIRSLAEEIVVEAEICDVIDEEGELNELFNNLSKELEKKIIDDRSPEVQDFIYSIIKDVLPFITPSQAAKYFDKIAEAIKSQENLSLFLEAKCNEAGKEEATSKIKGAFDAITNGNLSLEAIFDQLTCVKPQAYSTQYVSEFWGLKESTQIQVMEDFINRFGEKFFKGNNSFQGDSPLKVVFERFLPAEEEATEEIIEKRKAGNLSISEVKDFILDGFSEHATPSMKSRILVSLLTAIKENNPKIGKKPDDVLFGYKLGVFCRVAGAGGEKIGQKIHSFWKTPEGWLPGLEFLKTEPEKIPRWTAWRQIRSNSLTDRIKTLGRHCGTGAYFYTYSFEPTEEYVQHLKESHPEVTEGAELALQIRKPDASSQATELLEVATDITQDLMEKRKHIKDTRASLEAIYHLICHGRRKVQYETNGAFALKQETIARDNFEGLTIIIDGHNYRFGTAKIYDCGEEFKIAKLVKGTQINKLKKSVANQTNKVKNTKLACALSQMLVVLSGRASDDDCHGFNLASTEISDNDTLIEVFDYGGYALEEPKIQNKLDFADICASALFNSLRNKYGLPGSIKHTMYKTAEEAEKIGDTEELFTHVDAVVQGILSTGDFIKGQSTKDIGMMLLALAESGSIDSSILSRIISRSARRGFYLTCNKLRIAGLVSWLPAIKREIATESIYYPSNPNPFRRFESKNTEDSKIAEAATQPTTPDRLIDIKVSWKNDSKKGTVPLLISLTTKAAKLTGLHKRFIKA